MKSRTGIMILSPSTWTFSACLLTVFRTCCATEESRPVKVKPGDDVTLQCQGSRAANIIVLKWIRPDLKSEGFVYFFRDKHSYKSYQHSSFHGRVELRDSQMKDGDVSVILRNVSIVDAGTYECHVAYGGSPEIISSIELKVEDVDSQELTVKPGDDVPLLCWGPGDGDVIMLSWSRPDLKSEGFVFFVRDKRSYEKYQLPSFRGRVELKDQEMKDGNFSVILKNVTVDDAGTYECHVGKSKTGNGETHTPEHMSIVYLKVEDPGPTVRNIRGRGSDEFGFVVALWVSVFATFLFVVFGCCYVIKHPPAAQKIITYQQITHTNDSHYVKSCLKWNKLIQAADDTHGKVHAGKPLLLLAL